MENSTYSYTEYTLSWRALEFRGLENTARFFFISLVCGSGRVCQGVLAMTSLRSGWKAGGSWLWHFLLERCSRVGWWTIRKMGNLVLHSSCLVTNADHCSSHEHWQGLGLTAGGEGMAPMFSCKRQWLSPWLWTPGYSGGAEGQPSCACIFILQLVNLDVISESLSKMLRGPLFLKVPGMTLLVVPSVSHGGTEAPWAEAKHIHNNNNKKNRVKLSSKKDMSENRGKQLVSF